jgi:hypothetical protein
MLTRFAELGLRAPKRVLVVAGLLLVLAAIFGGPVASHLESGGFTDPAADSTKAANLLDAKFHGRPTCSSSSPPRAAPTRQRPARPVPRSPAILPSAATG